MSDKLPIIQQLHDADSDRERADILLRCPDALILKYAQVFEGACRHFEAGRIFVERRLAILLAVRNSAGGLPGKLALDLEVLRAELVAYAAGAPVVNEPPPALDI